MTNQINKQPIQTTEYKSRVSSLGSKERSQKRNENNTNVYRKKS